MVTKQHCLKGFFYHAVMAMLCPWQEECGWQHGNITVMILKHKQRQGFQKIKSDLDFISIALIVTIKRKNKPNSIQLGQEKPKILFPLVDRYVTAQTFITKICRNQQAEN